MNPLNLSITLTAPGNALKNKQEKGERQNSCLVLLSKTLIFSILKRSTIRGNFAICQDDSRNKWHKHFRGRGIIILVSGNFRLLTSVAARFAALALRSSGAAASFSSVAAGVVSVLLSASDMLMIRMEGCWKL